MIRKYTAVAAAALVSVLASFASAAPASNERIPYLAEMESCIDTVDQHLELANARHVRHFVSDADRRDIGYALTIETTVRYGDGTGSIEKRYETYCVARGGNDPSTFRIEEIEA